MFADPHKNECTIYRDTIRDLNLIRDDVASLARTDSNGGMVLYRARLLQAKLLMALTSIIHGSWTDAFFTVQRYNVPGKSTTDAVEAVYYKHLISKLENTVEAAWINFGGRSGEDVVRGKEKPVEADIIVLAAEMMHQCIAGYCAVYIERLRERLAEIRNIASIPTL